MEEIQNIIERIKADISGGKPDEEISRSLLPLIEKDQQLSEKLIERIGSIPDPAAGKVLHRLFDMTQDKRTRKSIKRSLYRLRSKGILLEDISPERGPSILHPLQADPGEGYASGIDSFGARLLLLAIPHPGRGLTVMDGVVSDSAGLSGFLHTEMARKGFRSFLIEVREKYQSPVVEMEPSYVAFLFTRAYQYNLENKGKESPLQEFLHVRKEIEKIKKDYSTPLVYSLLQTDAVTQDDRVLERGGDLLKADVFSDWRIEGELIRPYVEEIREAETSKIVLNPAQKEMRIQAIFQRAFSELFPGERRALYQRRLEEMAYLLVKLGRVDEAKTALSLAIDMGKPLHPIRPNPFLLQLVIRSITSFLTELLEKESKSGSLIIKP